MQGSQSTSAPPLVVTHNRRPPPASKINSWNNGSGVNNNDPSSVGGLVTSPEEQESYLRSNCAVYVRNLCKRYDTRGPAVVENLCMNVRKGTIYGLLGSSGCGKTTLLSFFVGLRQWDSGEVLVFGKKPGSKGSCIPGKRLGYMPQDVALYNQLSIRETIQFYGRLYNITSKELKARWLFLNRLLELPTNFKLVGDLSGGQKRRASLALALIHSPDLLVLDEPTVGLDPLLRRSIWNHLYKIVSTLGTSIIITTHYIEEARLSNTIGVMRNGRLLVEDSPLNLLQNYRCDLLEEVVVQLCRKDERHLEILGKTPAAGYGKQVVFRSPWGDQVVSTYLGVTNEEHEWMKGIFRKVVGFDEEISQNLGGGRALNLQNHSQSNGIFDRVKNTSFYQSLQRVFGFSVVITLTFMRHPLLLAMIVLIPSIQGTLTIWGMGSRPRDLPLGIVNHELSNWTVECSLSQHSVNSCDVSALSCQYLNELKKTDLVDLRSFDTEEDALVQVSRAKLWGYVSIPENYTRDGMDLAVAGKWALNESIEGSRIRVRLDYSQYVASLFIVRYLYNTYVTYVQNVASTCGIGGNETELPLNFRNVYGPLEDNFTAFLMPGVMLASFLGMICVLTAVIYISDCKQGTLSRARVAGLQTTEIMASHLLTQTVVSIAQIVIWDGVLHFIFGVPIKGPTWLWLLFCLMAGISGAAFGLLLGVVCKDEVEVMVIGVFVIPIFLLYGGVLAPIEGMSAFWQRLGSTLPTTLPTLSLRSIIIRGLGLSHPTVWPGFVALIVWILVPLIGSWVANKKIIK